MVTYESVERNVESVDSRFSELVRTLRCEGSHKSNGPEAVYESVSNTIVSKMPERLMYGYMSSVRCLKDQKMVCIASVDLRIPSMPLRPSANHEPGEHASVPIFC